MNSRRSKKYRIQESVVQKLVKYSGTMQCNILAGVPHRMAETGKSLSRHAFSLNPSEPF